MQTISPKKPTLKAVSNLSSPSSKGASTLPSPSISRKCSQIRSYRPSMINVILTCALLTVLATRRRLPLLEDAYESTRYSGRSVAPLLYATSFPVVRRKPQKASVDKEALSRIDLTAAAAYSTAHRFDADLSAAARHERPMPGCVDKRPARSFLMVFMGHSGSSAILSEIREHPDVHMRVMELVDHQERFNSTLAALTTRRFFEAGIAAGKVPGFKIRPFHLFAAPELFRNIVRDFDTRILWQYRKNIFKASVGEYAVRYLQDRRSIEGLRQNLSENERCAQKQGCSFNVRNITFLHRLLRSKVHSHNLITQAVHSLGRANGNCIREIPYEDYLYNRQDTMLDIFKFLGLPQSVTAPQRFKANSDNLCRVVENWHEVCRLFYSCITWQHMLDDPRNDCFCDSPGGPSKFCHVD